MLFVSYLHYFHQNKKKIGDESGVSSVVRASLLMTYIMKRFDAALYITTRCDMISFYIWAKLSFIMRKNSTLALLRFKYWNGFKNSSIGQNVPLIQFRTIVMFRAKSTSGWFRVRCVRFLCSLCILSLWLPMIAL